MLVQFNLKNTPLNPYFKIKGGYAFSFTGKYSKEGDEDRENIQVSGTNGFYGGGALGCSFAYHMGLELGFDASSFGFLRSYDAPTKKGDLINQRDKVDSWLLSSGIKVFYNF